MVTCKQVFVYKLLLIIIIILEWLFENMYLCINMSFFLNAEESSHSIASNMLDCDIIVSEFELRLHLLSG